MSDNKDNNPNSFDSYTIIGSYNNKNEQPISEEGTSPSTPVSPLPSPAQQNDTSCVTPSPSVQQNETSYGAPPAKYSTGSGSGYDNQYAKISTKKTGQAGAVFWLLLGLLAMFNLLLFIGGSGILFFVLSIIVLVGMYVMRGRISGAVLKTILYFGGAFLVTLAIFAFAGTGGSNEANISVGDDPNNKAFDFSFSIGNKDQANVVQAGFARSVEPNTLEPVEKTTVFDSNDEFIYYSVFVNYLPENTEIVTRWYYEGNLAVETVPETMATALENRYYTTHLQKGEKPFPVGNYQVELIMSKDGEPIFQCSDEFTVVADGGAQTSQANTATVLFADSFARADSNLVGNEWQEVRMRNGTGTTIPHQEVGDTPWSIENNTLCYEGAGNGTYTEDFIQTVREFPIDNTKVEFEIRGTASTTSGYVGPGAFWVPAAEKRLGSFTTIDDKQQLIGVQAFYGWESNGTKGLVFRLGGGVQVTDDILAGINQTEFVKHTIILQDGKMIYQVADGHAVSYDLVGSPEPGAQRHFSFDTRYYDNGVLFKTEIRNFKISAL